MSGPKNFHGYESSEFNQQGVYQSCGNRTAEAQLTKNWMTYQNEVKVYKE